MLPSGEFQRLLLKARDGDAQALNELLALLRPHLEQLARQYSDPAHAEASASDLVQEAWLRAWQKLDQFEGTQASDEENLAMFRTWVGQIVHRLGLNAKRDRRTAKRHPRGQAVLPMSRIAGHQDSGRKSFEPPAEGPSPSARLRTSEEMRLVQEALDAIPDAEVREILRLRFFEGLSLRQIAERTKLTYDQVRERYRQGLEKVGSRLGKLI
jgi:RNA polymerase sigma factor (sigma-70 family)